MSDELITLKIGIFDFTVITDALTDCDCLSKECKRLISNFQAQKEGEAVNTCFGCKNAVTVAEAIYYETYRLCPKCYKYWDPTP